MTGIQFVTDEKGRKVAVQIDLKKHRELWEEIEDVLASCSRRHEKRIPLEKVKAGLIKSGKLAREYLSRRLNRERGKSIGCPRKWLPALFRALKVSHRLLVLRVARSLAAAITNGVFAWVITGSCTKLTMA